MREKVKAASARLTEGLKVRGLNVSAAVSSADPPCPSLSEPQSFALVAPTRVSLTRA